MVLIGHAGLEEQDFYKYGDHYHGRKEDDEFFMKCFFQFWYMLVGHGGGFTIRLHFRGLPY